MPGVGLRRRRWAPTGNARVNHADPLSSGLRMCITGASWVDVVSGLRPSIAGQGRTAGTYGNMRSFTGTAGASIPLDLTGVSNLSIGVVNLWPSYANDDDLLLEFSANTNSNNQAFFIDPNSTEATNPLTVRWRVGGGNRVYGISRPTAAVVHTMLFSLPLNGAMSAWVDGVGVTTTMIANTSNSGTYGSSTLYIGGRAASSLLAVTSVALLAIWSRNMSDNEAAAFHADPYCMLRGA